MRFDPARAVADAVLFEGYALYPYRANAIKNQLRWQFGVLAPRAVSEATGADRWWLRTECLLEPDEPEGGARIAGRLRFLRLRRRTLEGPDGAPLASLEVGGQLLVPWDEGELAEHDFAFDLDGPPSEQIVSLDGDYVEEPAHDVEGRELGKVVRARAPLFLMLSLEAQPAGRLRKLRLRVENRTRCDEPRAPRDRTLASAAIGAHLLLAAEAGRFVSLLEPPVWAEATAASCDQEGVYPVLVGERARRDLLLASPIVLYDYPEVAPESPGDLFDATEIDEILTLRTLTLTDEEKRLARATDPRVAAIVDRADRLPEEAWSRLHGTFRDPRPGEAIRIGEVTVRAGSQVRLRPGRRADAQDMFLDGRVATVREIKRGVDGRDCLAVTVDDDPAAELHLWHGRYHYFHVDEVEPL